MPRPLRPQTCGFLRALSAATGAWRFRPPGLRSTSPGGPGCPRAPGPPRDGAHQALLRCAGPLALDRRGAAPAPVAVQQPGRSRVLEQRLEHTDEPLLQAAVL